MPRDAESSLAGPESDINPVNPVNPVQENYDFRELIPAVEKGETEINRTISNCDRSVGTDLSGWLVANKAQLTVNFGAGMTGGVAYVIDEAGDFDLKCNLDSIDLAGIAENSDDEQELLALIREHVERTGSPLATRILADWSAYRPKFVKVIPTRE